jgi:hypothetical protein
MEVNDSSKAARAIWKMQQLRVNQRDGTVRDGYNTVVGRQKWIGQITMSFDRQEDIILNCANEEEFSDRAYDRAEKWAKSHDCQNCSVHIDFSMPLEEFNDGK